MYGMANGTRHIILYCRIIFIVKVIHIHIQLHCVHSFQLHFIYNENNNIKWNWYNSGATITNNYVINIPVSYREYV